MGIESEKKEEPDYSVTIVSRGVVFAVPDRYLGARYYFGIPPWKRKEGKANMPRLRIRGRRISRRR